MTKYYFALDILLSYFWGVFVVSPATGTIPPRKISEPHGHQKNFDEIWYVYKGQGWHWMGRELHPQGPGWALWLVPEETHSLINPSDEPVEYIYIAG